MRRKAHSPLSLTNMFSVFAVVVLNCSGLLRCLKQGSRQFVPLLATRAHALASKNMDLQVVGYIWIGPDCGTKSKQKYILFILGIVKIQRSPYAHLSFTNLRINTDVLSPMSYNCFSCSAIGSFKRTSAACCHWFSDWLDHSWTHCHHHWHWWQWQFPRTWHYAHSNTSNTNSRAEQT